MATTHRQVAAPGHIGLVRVELRPSMSGAGWGGGVSLLGIAQRPQQAGHRASVLDCGQGGPGLLGLDIQQTARAPAWMTITLRWWATT
jgi:hypothetical protein